MKKAFYYRWVFSILVILVLTGGWFLKDSMLFANSEKILAKIGGKVFITQRDVDEILQRYENQRKRDPYTLEEKKYVLNHLIQNALISMEAEKEKLSEKPDIQSKLKIYKYQLLVKEYVTTKIEPLVTIKNEEIDEIMKNNPQLIPKEMLTVKEILVKTEKEAEEVYQELKKGVDFSKMASEKSIAPSKIKEGLVGVVSRGQLPPSEEAVIFALKEGEFSKPIQTEGGYRIYCLASKKQRPPEEVKMLEGKIREKVFQLEKNKKIEALMDKKVEEIKKTVRVETYFDQLK
jgi:peptidyl-prolyl cis-trans isomerase C